MKILVTDGNNRAALAITRSLGKKGYQILVGEKTSSSLAGASKYCQEKFQYPDPGRYPEDFIQCLIKKITKKKIEVILPVTEIATILVTENREQLEPYVKIPFSSTESIKLASDKSKIIEIARKLNIPIPQTSILESASDLKNFQDNFSYPIVLKSGRSRIFTDFGILSTSVSYARTKEELLSMVQIKRQQEFPILIQERISGPGIGVFVCYYRGKLIAKFGHKRLREKPPSGGVSTLRESVPVLDSALHYSQKLLDHLNWHGLAMVEFKLDDRDKIPKIMEVNARFWGSLQLAIDAGVDFPYLLIRSLEEKEIQPLFDYKFGTKTRWLSGDLDALLMILFKSRKELNLPAGAESRLRYLMNFLKFWEHDMHYEIESFSDAGPWWYEFRHWLFNQN